MKSFIVEKENPINLWVKLALKSFRHANQYKLCNELCYKVKINVKLIRRLLYKIRSAEGDAGSEILLRSHLRKIVHRRERGSKIPIFLWTKPNVKTELLTPFKYNVFYERSINFTENYSEIHFMTIWGDEIRSKIKFWKLKDIIFQPILIFLLKINRQFYGIWYNLRISVSDKFGFAQITILKRIFHPLKNSDSTI